MATPSQPFTKPDRNRRTMSENDGYRTPLLSPAHKGNENLPIDPMAMIVLMLREMKNKDKPRWCRTLFKGLQVEEQV